MESNSRILLLTNCTGRKRHTVSPGLTIRGLAEGTYDEVARQWVGNLRAAPWRHPVNTLYCGRVVTEVYAAAAVVGAEVAFVSAGLGLVSRYDNVPAYNLTASSGNADSVALRISEPYEPQRWWKALNQVLGVATPLRDRLQAHKSGLILISMPASYLKMTGAELDSLPSSILDRMRIIGPRHLADLPARIQSCWMPYDARLNSKSSEFRGTESDFPHRAVHHFVKKILGEFPEGNAVTHREAVIRALGKCRAPKRKRGISMPDQELLKVIRRMWIPFRGKRDAMLRDVRGVQNIACEQSRFKRLADQIKAEVNAKNK